MYVTEQVTTARREIAHNAKQKVGRDAEVLFA